MQLKDVIEQRKTIKMFNKSHKISREELGEIFRLAQRSPSKANLQPWRFVVVDDEAIKAELAENVAFNGPPCASASAVVLILADLHYEKLLGDILDQEVTSGCLHENFRENKFNFLVGVHNSLSPSDIRDQVLIDTSLCAMQLMLIAKDRGLDTHAIGIFDREAVLKLLNVDSDRYAPVMLLAIGQAQAPAIESSRLPLEYTVAWNSGESLS